MKLTRSTPIVPITAGVAKRHLVGVAAASTQSCSSDNSSTNDDDDNEAFVMAQDVAESLVTRTERKVQAFLQQSQWVRNHSKLADIPRLDASDFSRSKIIAEGGFSNLHEITAFHKEACPLRLEQSQQQQQDPTTSSSSSSSSTRTRYVVKHLKPCLALNPHKLKSAAKDICNEIHVLSALDHKHIVQVKALSSAGISGFRQTCRADSFFLVLEKLDQTLLHKISYWRQEGIRKQALSLNKLGKCQQTLALFQERLRVAQQLANALNYLHERRILHRDIKPGNVGFDTDGCVKLFDFGLAVELPPSDDPNATFSLGNAGTARYLAPEVIKKQPYNAKAESYSLSMLIWEIIALVKPFECLSGDEVKESVALIGFRPHMSRSWPKSLRAFLKRGWSKKMSQRPTMAEMESALGKMADADYTKNAASHWFVRSF